MDVISSSASLEASADVTMMAGAKAAGPTSPQETESTRSDTTLLSCAPRKIGVLRCSLTHRKALAQAQDTKNPSPTLLSASRASKFVLAFPVWCAARRATSSTTSLVRSSCRMAHRLQCNLPTALGRLLESLRDDRYCESPDGVPEIDRDSATAVSLTATTMPCSAYLERKPSRSRAMFDRIRAAADAGVPSLSATVPLKSEANSPSFSSERPFYRKPPGQ
jgi:hypothetical protein